MVRNQTHHLPNDGWGDMIMHCLIKIKSKDIPESRLVQLLVNLGQMRHLNNLVETDKTF